MDSISIVPEEFQEGINKIILSIDCLNTIFIKLQEIERLSNELGFDISRVKRETRNISSEINGLFYKLNVIKAIMMKMDPNIDYYFKNYKNNINEIDELKNKDNNSGADKSLDADSILKNNTALDELKTSNGRIESDKSTNTGSILDILKTKEGVNLVLDNLKNTGDDGSIKSMNTTSILNKEM